MKIFLDTASLAEIREAATLGVVDGITTNPSLLAKEKGDPEEILVEICKTIDGPISGEVVATDAEGMVREGRHLASLHKNIVVKCPCTTEGLKATKVLTAEADQAPTESMGAITDRSQEHLGRSDQGVAMLRKMFKEAMAAVEDGEDPPGVVREKHELIELPCEKDKFGAGTAFTDQWITGGSMRYSPIREQLLALHRDAAQAREKAASGA